MNKWCAVKDNSLRERSDAVLCVAMCLAFAFSALAAAPDARLIIAGVYAQDASRDMTLRAVLDIYGKDAQGRKKQFTLSRIGSAGDSKTLLRFTAPEEIRGVALLSINSQGATDRQWLYTPAIDRVRSISPRERSEKFAGSDFTYEDVAERVLDDFTYQMISDTETVENHKTYKIMATPVSADRSQYKYVYFWVAQDVPVILAAEMYDQDGKKIRVLHANQLKKVSGIWGARHVEMSSPAEDTRTTLTIEEVQFNTGLEESMFTPEALASSAKVNPGKSPRPHH
jgi:hypothetical protein